MSGEEERWGDTCTNGVPTGMLVDDYARIV